MMKNSSGNRYVTLRAARAVSRWIVSFYRSYRFASLAALFVGLVPTIYLFYRMLTTGFPKYFWGPFGKVTTYPGHFVVENIFRSSVSLASPEQSYADLARGWFLMLGMNFFGWLLIFVLVTAAFRWLRRQTG